MPFSLRQPLSADVRPTLRFERNFVEKLAPNRWAGNEVHVSSHCVDGVPYLYIYEVDGITIFHFTGAAEYAVGDDCVRCRQLHHVKDSVLENHFLSGLLVFWLAMQGKIAFHASVVEIDGKAVAFLAESTGGKSTIAAALVAQGFRLISDDDLILTRHNDVLMALPGYPTMRMWPDTVQLFAPGENGFDRVHPAFEKVFVPVGKKTFGSFCPDPVPLHRLYLPVRMSEVPMSAIIEELVPREALQHAYAHAVYKNLMHKLKRHQIHFEAVAEVVRKIKVRKITYKSGTELIPALVTSILDDLANFPAAETVRGVVIDRAQR